MIAEQGDDRTGKMGWRTIVSKSKWWNPATWGKIEITFTPIKVGDDGYLYLDLENERKTYPKTP